MELFSFKSFNRMGFVVFTPIVGRSNSSLHLVLGLLFGFPKIGVWQWCHIFAISSLIPSLLKVNEMVHSYPFIRMSANWSPVFIKVVQIVPLVRFSLIKSRLISIYLVRSCCTRWAILMGALLSQYSLIKFVCSSPRRLFETI